ncbi:MAG: ribonuclease HI [Myxococcales bacterium]|nr:ribonuclease HI [Myxococcales bacterium]
MTTYFRGPQDGVFTDGGARPNPGQGGWGWVYVEAGRILAQGHGGDRQTTNNRMEMSAIIDALRHLPPDAATVLYSDSDLCIKTLTQWARGWEARGWRKKDGEIKNLDLVQQAWALVQERPHVRLQWIKAHDGSRWNEYVDALATEFLRGR